MLMNGRVAAKFLGVAAMGGSTCATAMKYFLRLIFLMTCLPVLTQGEVARPNVVFIITDDQSWDTLGFMGGKVHTPRLDQMVKEGMLLTDFNVTSTVCSPSRYSFLTGRYASRCRGDRFMKEHPPGDQTQVENIGELEAGELNLCKILQGAGYRTGFVGKSHVIRHDWLEGHYKAEEGPLEFYPQDSDPRDPEVNAKMQRNHQRWCEEIKKYGFDFADGVYAANLKELRCDALNVHNLDWTVAKAFEFLDSTSEDEPFFLYFSTTLHHGPAPWNDRFSIEADPCLTGEGYVAEAFDVLPVRGNVIERNRDAGFDDKKAFALWLDDGVGAILDKIEVMGISEDTLIIFVPDHGSYRHSKATLHDFGMRVPMVLQWKGTIEAGSSYDGIVANIDLAPTLMDLAGAEKPPDYMVDGVSFVPVIHGSSKPIRNVLFGELGHSRAVKSKDWKYIAVRYPEEVQRRIDEGKSFKGFKGEVLELPYLTRNGHLGHHAARHNPNYFEADQLYDLQRDPEETKNVITQNPEVAERLKVDLAKALKQFENRPFGEFTE